MDRSVRRRGCAHEDFAITFFTRTQREEMREATCHSRMREPLPQHAARQQQIGARGCTRRNALGSKTMRRASCKAELADRREAAAADPAQRIFADTQRISLTRALRPVCDRV